MRHARLFAFSSSITFTKTPATIFTTTASTTSTTSSFCSHHRRFMGSMVSRYQKSSSSSPPSSSKQQQPSTNEKKRQRGGGGGSVGNAKGGRTLTTTTATAATAASNDDNSKSDEKKKKKNGEKAKEEEAVEAVLKTPTKKKTTSNNVKHESSPPKNWEETLRKIKEMRKNGPLAPVDTMGCEKIAETDDKKQKRYRTLISAMLSSQTKDQINHATMNKLIALNKDTAEGILNTTEDELDEIIHQVGFHRNKAKYLRAAAKICIEKYGGDIPPDLESLVELPGVGPKMGHLIMNVGWEKPSGICVDVHVHRITERLGWVSESCAVTSAGSPRKRTPEDTRIALEKWLPKDEWVEINPLLVGFGQLYCTPLRPKCSECDVADLCQNAFRDATPMKKSKAA